MKRISIDDKVLSVQCAQTTHSEREATYNVLLCHREEDVCHGVCKDLNEMADRCQMLHLLTRITTKAAPHHKSYRNRLCSPALMLGCIGLSTEASHPRFASRIE